MNASFFWNFLSQVCWQFCGTYYKQCNRLSRKEAKLCFELWATGGGLIIFLLPFDILVTKFQLYFIRKDYSKGNNIVENNILRI